jgi:DNA-binding transcriptional MerR regulator
MHQAEDLYRIGSVAKLTGIAVERLRAWERRYGVAPAQKVGKTRYYSDEQVIWLKAVRTLIDSGQPISSLVSLSLAQLEARLTPARTAQPDNARAARAALIGSNLLLLEQQASTRLQVVSRSANIDAFLAAWDVDDPDRLQPDVLVVQIPVLQLTPLQQLQDVVPEAELLVLYEFATPSARQAAQAGDFDLLSWPQSLAEIERLATQAAGSALVSTQAAERHFSDEELIAIAGSQDDSTQCPRHLARLITDLNAFAAYAEALVEEDASAARGPLAAGPRGTSGTYRTVHAEATQARALLERSLERLVEQDHLYTAEKNR